MLTPPAEHLLNLSMTQQFRQQSGNWTLRKIWLPKIVYDCVPYFYLTAGFAALFATLYITDWFWVLPHYIIFSVACLHMAFRIFNFRRSVKNKKEEARDQAPTK